MRRRQMVHLQNQVAGERPNRTGSGCGGPTTSCLLNLVQENCSPTRATEEIVSQRQDSCSCLAEADHLTQKVPICRLHNVAMQVVLPKQLARRELRRQSDELEQVSRRKRPKQVAAPKRTLFARPISSSLLLCVLFTLTYSTLSLLLVPQLLTSAARSSSSAALAAYTYNSQPTNPFLIYENQFARQAAASSAAASRRLGANRLGQPQQADGQQSVGGGGGGDSLLVCPDGWQQHSTQCYKFFQQRHSWQRARDTCERFGAQLALVLDYQQNNFTSQLGQLALNSPTGSSAAAAGPGDLQGGQSAAKAAGGLSQPLYLSDERSYWIGFRAIDRLETNTLESAANTFVSKYSGFWDYDEPRVSSGECVRATLRQDHTNQQQPNGAHYKLVGQHHSAAQHNQQVWQLARCEDLLPFVCQRQVCSSNSFHCSNGRCVNAAWKCDGHNDCGDDSDEMDCPRRCRFHMTSSGDKVQSINYPQRYEPNSDCKWTLEGPLDAGMMLQFYEFDTEKHFDQVQVLTGARTEDKAYALATLSGQLNLTSKPLVSGSNLMIVKFKSDSLVERRGFRASWKTEPIECGGEL